MPQDPALLMEAFVSFAIGFGLFVLVVVLSIQDHSRFRINWRTGIVVGLVWFLLRLPSQVFILTRVQALVASVQQRTPDANPEMLRAFIYVGLVVGFTISVLGIFWYTLVYHAAADQWEKVRPGAFPLLQRTGRTPWRAVLGAAAFGVAVGALSDVVFGLIGVHPSEMLRQYQALGQAGGPVSPALRVPIAALAITAVALGEEVTFRGVLFGWLQRVFGREGRAGVTMAAVLSSLVWAAAHIPNTDAPLVKCAQIFVFGLFLCWFVRKWCLEAAIAAHAGLNLAALFVGLAIH